MKKQVSPAVTIAVAVVVVVAVAIFGWKELSGPDYSNVKQSDKKIVFPPSQIGTKVGNHIVTNDDSSFQGSAQRPPAK